MSKIIIFIVLFFAFNAQADESFVLDKNIISNTKSTFCNHKFLFFLCFKNKYPASNFSSEFFSLLGNSFTIQIVSDVDNFISKEKGLFSVGNDKADPLKREDLVSLGNFYKKGPEWKKTGQLIVWSNGLQVFTSKLEFQINGQDSRSAPQKAIRLKLETPLPLSSYSPRVGLSRLTIYPIYGSLGGAKVFHYIINEIFRHNEIWFEEWQVVPVVINNEFWGTYFLARPDLEIQEDHYGTTEGIEGSEFKDFLSKNPKNKFNKEALLKFMALQAVVGNEDIYRNFRVFTHADEFHFTYTDLDETFNRGITTDLIIKNMENEKIKQIYLDNIGLYNKYVNDWTNVFQSHNATKVYDKFVADNYLYLFYNDLRWGKPFRSGEDKSIKKKIQNFIPVKQ